MLIVIFDRFGLLVTSSVESPIRKLQAAVNSCL